MAYSRLLRETLGKLLAKRNDLQVVGQSAATVERVQELTQSCADLLLLNSGGDVTSDLSIVRMARMHAPGVRIMMLGMNDEPQEFLKCIRGGIAGYVFRDASSQREQELVPLLARGASNKEIADQFCLSEQTVKNHLYRMKQKVGAANRLGIVHLCRSHGLNV